VTGKQRMSYSPVVSILCCLRRSASVQRVLQLSLQAGLRPQSCGTLVPVGVSE
jgi:hypothetical protein